MTGRQPITPEHDKVWAKFREARSKLTHAEALGCMCGDMPEGAIREARERVFENSDPASCEHPHYGCKEKEFCYTCANNNHQVWGRVRAIGGYDEFGRWQSITLDELKIIVDQPYYDPAEEARDKGWGEPSAWCFDFKSLSPWKNGITDRDRARKKLQHRLKMRAAQREKMLIKESGGKKCRMKACNGAIHLPGEKCPTMAALGRKGGKAGKGDSKARTGDKNGRTKRRQCCGTMYRSPHALTCKKAKPTLRKDAQNLKIRKIHKEAIKKPEISWAGFAVPPAIMGKAILRTIRGTCGGCSKEMPAREAVRIHRADLVQDKQDARLICGGCA